MLLAPCGSFHAAAAVDVTSAGTTAGETPMTNSSTLAPGDPATQHSQVEHSGSVSNRSARDLPLERESVVLRPHVMRFRRSERRLHWAIAVPFMVCFATALTLVLVYNPAPQRAWRWVFSWTHRVSGLCLLVFPTLVAIRNRRDSRIHFDNIKQAWVWSLSDLKWIALMGAAAVSRRVSLPEAGKFNAAEKLNFMIGMTTWPLFIVTGVLIWLPGVDVYAWFAHFGLALLVAPLMLGHICMATINPSTRRGLQGMVSGFVDREWARHHYARWYRETFEKTGEIGAARAATAPEPRIAACCTTCGRSHAKLSWAEFVQTRLQEDRLLCPSCKTEKRIVLVVAERESERLIEHFMDRRPDAGPFAGGLPRDQVLVALVGDRDSRSI
jgi:formate dehydrogenase subunit gamma